MLKSLKRLISNYGSASFCVSLALLATSLFLWDGAILSTFVFLPLSLIGWLAFIIVFLIDFVRAFLNTKKQYRFRRLILSFLMGCIVIALYIFGDTINLYANMNRRMTIIKMAANGELKPSTINTFKLPAGFGDLSCDGEVVVNGETIDQNGKMDPRTIRVSFMTFSGVLAGKGFAYSAEDRAPNFYQSSCRICKNWYQYTQ